MPINTFSAVKCKLPVAKLHILRLLYANFRPWVCILDGKREEHLREEEGGGAYSIRNFQKKNISDKEHLIFTLRAYNNE